MLVSIMLAVAILPSDCPRGPMSVEKYRQYAPRVYQRPVISQDAHGRLEYMTRCQRSEWASREVRRLHNRLLQERAGLRVVWRMQRVVRPHRSWLRSVRDCESGGNYRVDAYHDGAYQFHPRTWVAAGGSGFAWQASPLEQDYRAVLWAQRIGWANVRTSMGWPHCG